jgi:hypothetical protein
MSRTTMTTLLGAMLLAAQLPADGLASPTGKGKGSGGGKLLFERYQGRYSRGKG